MTYLILFLEFFKIGLFAVGVGLITEIAYTLEQKNPDAYDKATSPDYETTVYITSNLFFLLGKTIPSLTVLYKLITSIILTSFRTNIKIWEYSSIAVLCVILIVETVLLFVISNDEITFYCDLAMVILTILLTIT